MRCVVVALAFAFATEALAGEAVVENRVVSVAVTVEVVDSANNKVKTRFDLEPKTKKAVELTGNRVEVTVYEKGSKRKVADGQFPSGTTVIIERLGTTWKLKSVR